MNEKISAEADTRSPPMEKTPSTNKKGRKINAAKYMIRRRNGLPRQLRAHYGSVLKLGIEDCHSQSGLGGIKKQSERGEGSTLNIKALRRVCFLSLGNADRGDLEILFLVLLLVLLAICLYWWLRGVVLRLVDD